MMLFKSWPWLRTWQNQGRGPSPHAAARLGKQARRPRSARLALKTLEARVLPAGTWTPLAHLLPNSDSADVMMLLSDGTVMVQGGGNSASSSWYRLSPDSQGHYVQGN